MIDLHTHILCGMDDGARDAEMSLQMLKAEQAQGVDTVVLTPHYYRHRESVREFLRRRQEAVERLERHLERLSSEERAELPKTVLGAEVAWVPNLADCEDLDKLCLNGTKYLLLELPYGKWDHALVDQVYNLMTKTGLTPVLAHLDRYRGMQPPQQIRKILELELPMQINSSMFLHLISRGYGIRALQQYAHVVASDCHDCSHRPPNLRDAMQVIEKKLGREAAVVIDANARLFAGL